MMLASVAVEESEKINLSLSLNYKYLTETRGFHLKKILAFTSKTTVK